MLDLEDRLDELNQLGLHQRMRMVSGPQGPRVVLDGRPVLLFGSGALANLGVIPALARRGEIVLHDELSHSSIVDGCRLSGADAVAYRHADPEHLAWALRQCDGRATLIATDGMFGMDGDV